ncbi:MAG: hypothetical protein HY690_13745 [Chloroflexi bacterium]|nr:hypothetical protein [Chloroflexota bacterium]
MYGWRGLVGYVNPAVWGSPARDFQAMLPDGVGLLVATLSVERLADDELEREQQLQLRAAQALARNGAQFIIAGGGPMVVAGGPGRDVEIINALTEATGVRATTNLTAAVEALRALGARRIALASPFRDQVNERYGRFLAASGFEVAAIHGLQCASNREIGELDDYASYRAARAAAAAAGALDAIYLPCGRWPAASMIAPLEADLGSAVVTSNQACAWAALKALGVRDPVSGYGRLFSIR